MALQPSTGKNPGCIRFEVRDLSMRGPVRVPIYSQPLGVSYDPVTDQLVIADHYQPQVRLGRLRQDSDDIVMDMTFIRGAEGTTRLFPGMFQGPYGPDFSRAQTAFLGKDGRLYVTRNGDRKIFVISPPAKEGGRWSLSGEIIFPDDVEAGTMVHSIFCNHSSGLVRTIESDVRCEKWTSNSYELGVGVLLRCSDSEPTGAFRYGIGDLGEDDWTITDFRTEERPGVYAGDKLVIPGLCGNGIAFLPSGDAIVTQYGSSIEQPGALVFVPAHMFK